MPFGFSYETWGVTKSTMSRAFKSFIQSGSYDFHTYMRGTNHQWGRANTTLHINADKRTGNSDPFMDREWFTRPIDAREIEEMGTLHTFSQLQTQNGKVK